VKPRGTQRVRILKKKKKKKRRGHKAVSLSESKAEVLIKRRRGRGSGTVGRENGRGGVKSIGERKIIQSHWGDPEKFTRRKRKTNDLVHVVVGY